MAGANNIEFRFRTKGADKVKQDLSSLAGAVDREAQKLDRKAQDRTKKRQSSAEKRGDGDSFAKRAGAVAVGSALGGAAQRSFSAFNRNVAQAFDPNLSPVEKELNLAKAALDLIPFEGGEIPKALLQAQTQEIVGGAQGTGGRINAALGPAFQAAGNLSDEEFRKRFEPQIERLREIIEPQERARERGSQLIAENLGSFVDEFKKIQSEVAPESTKETVEANTQSQKDLKASIDKLTNTLLGFSVGGVTGGVAANLKTPGKVD